MALRAQVPMIRQAGFAIFALAALAPAVARPDQGSQLMKKWGASDHCSQQAYRDYPDYTADSLARRDQALKKCLAGGNLPPRDLPSPGKP
jgi:hypothetical protein